MCKIHNSATKAMHCLQVTRTHLCLGPCSRVVFSQLLPPPGIALTHLRCIKDIKINQDRRDIWHWCEDKLKPKNMFFLSAGQGKHPCMYWRPAYTFCYLFRHDD